MSTNSNLQQVFCLAHKAKVSEMSRTLPHPETPSVTLFSGYVDHVVCFKCLSRQRVLRWKLFNRSLSSRDDSCVCHGNSRDMVVLGIESSCDDTGVGVVSSSGRVLGEAVHSQLPVHLK